MIVIKEGVYVQSKQKAILNRVDRAPWLWRDCDPTIEVVVGPVGLIREWEYVSSIIARPISMACKVVVSSYDTATISLSDRIAKGAEARSCCYWDCADKPGLFIDGYQS